MYTHATDSEPVLEASNSNWSCTMTTTLKPFSSLGGNGLHKSGEIFAKVARLIVPALCLTFLFPLAMRNAFAVTYVNTGLPIVRVYTNPIAIDAITRETWIPGTVIITSPDSSQILYQGTMTTKGRGNATWSYPKKGYRIKLDNKPGGAILDMPADTQWVLIANYADRSLVRYVAALDLAGRINNVTGSPVWVPKMRYVELYWNDEYRGNYLFGERIKVSKDRMNIYSPPKPNDDGTTSADVTGGYVMQIDAENLEPTDVYFRTITMQLPFVFYSPNGIVPPNPDFDTSPMQIQYFQDFINHAEQVLYSSTYRNPSTGYAKYYDVGSVINWFTANEIYKNQDAKFTGWDGSSVYWFKDTDMPAPDQTSPRSTQNGKLFMGPVWDFDYGAGNYNGSNAKYSDGWWVYNANYIKRMMGDSAFKAKVKSTWNSLKTAGIIGTNANNELIKTIDAQAAYLQKSQVENFKRWPILNRSVWPSPERLGTYSAYVASLKKWLIARMAWMDAQIQAFPNQ